MSDGVAVLLGGIFGLIGILLAQALYWRQWRAREGPPATSDAALLPCPFCGRTPDVRVFAEEEWYRVGCRNPRCPARPAVYASSWQRAFRKWNRRSEK